MRVAKRVKMMMIMIMSIIILWNWDCCCSGFDRKRALEDQSFPTSSINTNTAPIIGIVRLFSNASSLRPCLHLQKIGCEKAFYFPIMICWVPRDAYSSSQFPILHHFYPCHHHQPQGSHPHHHHRDLFSRQGSHILLSYSPGCTSLTLSDAYYLALIPTFIYATKNGAANFWTLCIHYKKLQQNFPKISN